MRHAVGVLLMLSACGGGSGEPASVSPAVLSTNEDSPLGINLTPGGLASQTPEICFKDLFKQAGPWLSSNGLPFAGAAADGTPIPGVGQTAYTQMCRSLYGHYPGGSYTCLYDGSGTIIFGYDAAMLSQSAGQILVDVTPSNTADGITVRIPSSSLADPIRNIRFVPQTYLADYATQPFTPTFLARWARFKTIRFMNWESLNTSTLENWAERPTTEGPQTGSNGVAIEYMILLANAIHADPWFCMPPRATDDFVAQFAALVHASLDPDLRIYLEYGNEAWKPVYRFARRAWAKSAEDAKDHAQGFFAWLLERDLFAKYDPSSCSFRTYLKSLLRNFAGNEHQALRRLKRGGGLRFVPIDDEPAADSTPEDAFDRAWRADVVARAIARVKEHYASRRRPVPFLVFEASLAEPSYPALASRFGVKTGNVRNYLHEVRDRVRLEVRAELEATGERSELAEEIIEE